MICEVCKTKPAVEVISYKDNKTFRRKRCQCGIFTTVETKTEEQFPWPKKTKPKKKKNKQELEIQDVFIEEIGIHVNNKSPEWLKKLALKFNK
jgi:hypothetical protein